MSAFSWLGFVSHRSIVGFSDLRLMELLLFNIGVGYYSLFNAIFRASFVVLTN